MHLEQKDESFVGPQPESERTFVIRSQGSLWQLSGNLGRMGGLFISLDAALAFTRRECPRDSSTRVIVLDEAGTAFSPRAA